MIDNITFQVHSYSESEWNNLLSKLENLNLRENTNGNKLYFDFSNLRIEYFPHSNLLWVRNSLHKFYNSVVSPNQIGEENYNDYGYWELAETIHYLSEFIQRKPKEMFVIGAFEFGVNLQTNRKKVFKEIIDSFLSYQSTTTADFYVHNPPKGGSGKITGKSVYLSDFRIKIYDKSSQAKRTSRAVPSGLLRFELCNKGVGRLKKLLDLKEVSLNEFLDVQTLRELVKELIKTFDRIVKMPTSHDEISKEDLLEIIQFTHPLVISYEKKTMTSWRYNQLRKKRRVLMENDYKSPKSLHYQLRKKLIDKLENLTSFNPCINKGQISND